MSPEQEDTARRQMEFIQGRLEAATPESRAALERMLGVITARLGGAGQPEIAALIGLAGKGGGEAAVGRGGDGRDRFAVYRGDPRAAVGLGGTLAFVTVHPEGLPTALYRLDADKLTLQAEPLPCGGVALAAADDGKTLYLAGTDRRVYEVAGKKGPRAVGEPFGGAVAAVVPVSNKRLAVLAGKQLHILKPADGAVLQAFDLPDDGSALAADPTGQWLAAGTVRGTVAVFDGQDKDEFEPAEAEKLHDGAVTALLFEPEELRFFSAGADNKLLSTFARGRLEPEDKGRANGHEDVVTALLAVPGDRFVSGSRDATLKNWPRAGAVKPATLKDACGRVVALARVDVYNQPHVAALCDDTSIRLFKLEADGRFGDEPGPRLYGAMGWVKNELAQQYDPKRRDKALKTLAGWKDAASIDLLAARAEQDPDDQLRLSAVQLLATSDHPRAPKLLEKAVGHRDGKVRVAAFNGLYRPLKPDFGPLDLALKTGQADVGTLAVQALVPLAGKDDQALTRLTAALDAPTWDVRKAALAGLEGVFGADSPQASLTALGSQQGDVRAAALTRAFERGLLADAAIGSAVRRRLEDPDAAVRKVAFLLSVESRPALAGVVRAADGELNRQLNELEKADKSDRPAPEVAADARTKLTAADYDVLLQATASRALDTCLRGARGLAVLRDPRAFGLLLQLSREDDPAARVGVCRALAALDDPRAVNRLRSLVFDREPSVRDAAYTALAAIFENDPLAVAEAGLTAADEDVRRRGLETLTKAVRKRVPTDGQPGWDLLVRALNDAAPGVRSEAFKAALNLKVGGGGPDTLRFALRSIHPDIRREVLTEVTAQEKEAWATPLLYEFFNDPDPGLRAEAFGLATKKNKDVAVLETALGSRYADARKLAVEGLVKKHSKAAQAVLVKAVADPDQGVRLAAIAGLVDDDAFASLRDALSSPRADVRVRAAAALARHGDPTALAPLRELATAPEPEQKERVGDWQAVAVAALYGLAELGRTDALQKVLPLLDSPHAAIRKAAAAAAAWSSRAETVGPLRSALAHHDPEVRYRAALGLAYLGDVTVLPLVQAGGPGGTLADEAFAATVALGPAAGSALAVYLDHPDEALRNRALLALLLLELTDTDGVPEKALECLSAKGPRYRLTGARAVEAFADPAALKAVVVEVVNDRGDDKGWTVSAEVVDDLARLLAFAPPQIKAATALQLKHFAEKEQARWNQAWGVHSFRFGGVIKDVRREATAAGVPVPSKLSPAELRELAFGGYVGLVREQGGSAAGPAVGKVRQTALSRLFAIATADAGYVQAARPVLVQAMGDPNQPVRTQAFEHLQALGVDRATLGGEALEAGFTDLGVKGLELLTEGTSSKQGDGVLERVMLTRTDDLATEAAKLLVGRRGRVPTAAKAVEAVNEPTRLEAVRWLAAEYEASADAQAALRKALGSRYRKVRESAAFELAGKKDPAAFDALAKMLPDPAFANRQKALVTAFAAIGDKRAAGVLLDRVENDPAGTADADALIPAAAEYRDPSVVDRLLALAEARKPLQKPAFRAVYTISGHDQPVIDPEDENPLHWPERDRQHPRHDDVLAKLMDRAFAAGDTGLVAELIPAAQWSRGKDVDPVFAVLVSHPDADLRNAAVVGAGVRFQKRGGPADPLLKALKHKDPATQLYAAEGLAWGKRGEGVGVLLSSIDYLDDVTQRQRAVTALGKLGDPRAVDKLLQLAGEDGHALQEPAAEAIGHLKRSPQADAVFRLLERLAKGAGGVAQRAIIGLRWYDTPSGWDIVRAKAQARGYGWQVGRLKATAAEQLGYNDDSATRDLLLKLLRTEGADVVPTAFVSAARLFGKDSLDPHYQLLQNGDAADLIDGESDLEDVLKVVAEKGDPLRVMELFPKAAADVQEPLEAALLTRPNLPVKEAVAALAHADDGTVRLAARLLGRLPKPDAAVKKGLADALGRWWGTWQERRAAVDRNPAAEESLTKATAAVESLLWAAGRVGGADDALAAVAQSRPDDPRAKPIRLEAARCLVTGTPSAATLGVLHKLAVGADADVRVLAADLLARSDPKRAAKLAAEVLSDRPAFNRLAGAKAVPAKDVAGAAGQVHYQPVVLPVLVGAKDVPPLAAVAKDRKAAEAARLGAVEGLGAMADPAAEAVLVEVGTAADDDKDVRKAAWKALRRSKRARRPKPARGAKP